MPESPRKCLYYGDNLEVVRRHLPDETIDLVYLDPPFNSAKDYALPVSLRERQHTREEVKAFGDVWQWDAAARSTYADVVGRGGRLGAALAGLGVVLGESDLMAYLSMMAHRLTELVRIMKPTASLFLHCDPTASHYLKILLDAVLGPQNFRNEVVWRYRRWPTRSRQFQKMHDVLLFYSKSACSARPFNVLYGYESLAPSTLKTFGTRRQHADFSSGHRKPGTVAEPTPGPPLSDVWEVGIIAPISKERRGYPTQKPEALLERVIRATTQPGERVLDPFCGSGTTLAVAERLGRDWIGIDSTALALGAVKRRFREDFGQQIRVIGEPLTRESANVLAEQNPAEYVWWVLGLLGAEPAGAFAGTHDSVQGRITRSGEVLVAVRARSITPADVSGIEAMIDKRRARGGILVGLTERGSKPSARRIRTSLQILAVEDLLSGRYGDPQPAVARKSRPESRPSETGPMANRKGKERDLPLSRVG